MLYDGATVGLEVVCLVINPGPGPVLAPAFMMKVPEQDSGPLVVPHACTVEEHIEWLRTNQ